MIKILFQGDSITDGNRYKDPQKRWDLNHQIGHSYVFNIAGILGVKYPGKYDIINRGVSGDCVDRIAQRWQSDTINENPDILSLLLGINGNGNRDGKYPEGAETHLLHFERVYRELLTSACEANPNLKLIIIEPFMLPVGRYKEHYDEFIQVFKEKQKIISQIAQDYQATFIPVQERLEELVAETAPKLVENQCSKEPEAYWLWDGIHPTEAMHWFLSRLWLDATENII